MARQPYISDPDVTLWQGDCIEVLSELPEASVHMCATSPPFYGLRDYGVDGQIGLEETPEEWVERLITVFRGVRRVLRNDGTLWVEIGDSYAANRSYQVVDNKHHDVGNDMGSRVPPGYKQKDLLGQPWMLAFALRADGWYLRSEIIWHRPNPMPESVTDRPTKSHSTVFLLSKQPRYFYDADAIREAFQHPPFDGFRGGGAYVNQANGASNSEKSGDSRSVRKIMQPPQAETLDGSAPESPRGPDGRRATHVKGQDGSEQHRDGERWPNPGGANARSVWAIPTEPTSFQHFATWPRKLVAKMILAGTSEHGVCAECGAPWARDVEASGGTTGKDWNQRRANGKNDLVYGASAGSAAAFKDYRREMKGWLPGCGHDTQTVPAVVLDPFAGSGTTLLVARQLGRHAVGIELSPRYCKLASDNRLAQQSLFA